MSFTSDIKSELSGGTPSKPCCAQTELRALTQCLAAYAIHGRGRMNLVYRTASVTVAKRIFLLYRTFYHILPSLEYSSLPRFGGQRICVLRINEQDSLRMMNLTRGAIHHLPPKTLEKKCCFRAYMRGVFLSSGTASVTHRGYQLRLKMPNVKTAGRCSDLLLATGIRSQIYNKKDSCFLMLTSGDCIASFLSLIGAFRSMLAFEGRRIERESSKKANRALNCDKANLIRQTNAGNRQKYMIEHFLIDHKLSELSSDLAQIAALRLENPEASLTELGQESIPAISKTTLFRQLKRLENEIERISNESVEIDTETGSADGGIDEKTD